MITVRVDPIPPVFEQTIYNSTVPEVTGTVSVIQKCLAIFVMYVRITGTGNVDYSESKWKWWNCDVHCFIM